MNKRAPFVGRDRELETATHALKLRATDGLFVAGDSGVGKSRFIEEVCWTASLEGYEIMRVAATDGGADIPFGAFAHLLEGDSTTEEGSGSTPQTAKRLLQLAAGRRLVLVVDDAHFLDDPSAALVHKLVRGPRVFALLSITNRARTPQPILTLWKDDLIDRLELGALSREDLRRLVRARLGADIDGLTERSLWEATGGNLALHQELVTAGLETGNLRKTNDVWSWHGPSAVTSRLTEITAARLGCLEDEQRSALELLAIAAPIELNDIDGLVPYQVVEDLEARRILNVEHACGRSVVRFRYPLEGQVFGAGIPKLRARRYRLDLARQIERAGSRDPGVLSRIACWRLDSHQRQPADTLVNATSDAWGALQAPLVRRLGPAALQAGAGHQVTRHLVEALLLAGPAWEVESALEELQPILDGDQLAMVDLDRALNALIGQDDLPCAAGLLRQAGVGVTSPAAKAELQSLQALSYAFGGSNRECLTLT
ncbi:MAG: hypothetical protein QOH66_1932, partial [Actinomycetota bacterium]|nr:hypothetical protein [Actinomycetota bacterium]